MNMSRLPLPLLGAALLLSAGGASAHGLWIEPGQGGYRIFFGEPEHNLREKKGKLERFASLKAWKADGTEAKLEIREDHLFAASGTGGFAAANLDSPVREPKEGAAMPEAGGAVKSYQYLRYLDGLEGAGRAPAPLFLDIVPEGQPVPGPDGEAIGKGGLRFQVLKDNKPFEGAKVEVLAPNGWNRGFEAGKDGKVEILAPWPGLYILKASWKDRTPGEFKGRKYAVANHAITLSFVKP